MCLTAPGPPAGPPLADHLRSLVLDITRQLGWQHDALALELWRVTERVAERADEQVTEQEQDPAGDPAGDTSGPVHDRELHQARALLRHTQTTRSVDPAAVARALHLLDDLAPLPDP